MGLGRRYPAWQHPAATVPGCCRWLSQRGCKVYRKWVAAPDDIVIDPELPDAIKARLQRFPVDRMLPFTTSPREHRPEGRISFGALIKRLDHSTASGMKAVEAARGRYVRPLSDLDPEAQQIWRRAAAAVRKIRHSEVVSLGLVDSAEVTAALPYVEWNIAEKLARLTLLRASQRIALRGVGRRDPDMAALLEEQRAMQPQAVDEIESRVGCLEEITRLIERTERAIRRDKATAQLSGLADSHFDMVAGLAPDGNEQSLVTRLSLDLGARIGHLGDVVWGEGER